MGPWWMGPWWMAHGGGAHSGWGVAAWRRVKLRHSLAMLKGLAQGAGDARVGGCRHKCERLLLQPVSMDEKISRARSLEEKRPGAKPGLEYFAVLERRGRLKASKGG